ncbi:DUF4157 domain-containing protein [Fulvivirga sp. M361]|uniref:eCIS core domain-containing protein n=1 Tax=Fulvivirga sp. M361 TaxID=2594266 RepID=UPI001179B2B5|nr:DUF4157 domain-containing protein [Fulvivirga sp. M361]TRX59499.1 DUF4157 domain-containing protein [Fulvivirga sp. M361]
MEFKEQSNDKVSFSRDPDIHTKNQSQRQRIQRAVDPSHINANFDPSEKDTPLTNDSSIGMGPLPHVIQKKMEESFNTDFSSVKIKTNSAQAKSFGALAFAQGENVHFAPGQFNPESSKGQELIGHEFAHVVQQRQGRVQAGQSNINDDPGLEKEADTAGVRAARGEPSAIGSIEQQATANSKGPIQGYFVDNIRSDNYRVADDLSATVKVGYPNHVMYLASGKAATSNSALKSVGSGIKLKEMSPTIEVSDGTKKKTLKKVLPENLQNSTAGTAMDLWADCGKSAGVVVGSESRVGMYQSPGSGATIETAAQGPSSMRGEIMNAWLNHTYGLSTTSASKKTKIKKVLDAVTVIDAKLGVLASDYSTATTPSDKDKIIKDYILENDKKTEVLWTYYNGLTPSEQASIDQDLAINRYAVPEVGEGYTMASGGSPVPGYESDTWNFHWGGVVAESDDKKDKVTLENYAVGDPSIENKKWDFAMYGTHKAGQTFHEQHEDTNLHGQSPTTIRIKKK